MYALTIYQPWASLIMIGAKPYEFRRWDYSRRYPKLVNNRIVIHASARAVVPGEVEDIISPHFRQRVVAASGACPPIARAPTGGASLSRPAATRRRAWHRHHRQADIGEGAVQLAGRQRSHRPSYVGLAADRHPGVWTVERAA